jgi:hypothetical protein
MGYYQGDYYRGTAGDPFLGGLFSKVFQIGKGLLGGGGGSGPGGLIKAVKMAGFPGGSLAKVGQKVVGLAKAHPVLTGAGAAGIIGAMGAGAERELFGGGGGRMRGFHPCKSKHGCKSGAMVRNRHMNPCNPRALRRAIRRAHSFERLAKHVIGFSSPRKPKGHMYFKKRRRK